jgi:hypothetical protein
MYSEHMPAAGEAQIFQELPRNFFACKVPALPLQARTQLVHSKTRDIVIV